MSLSKIDSFVKEVKQIKRIDITKWKEFKMSTLFDISGTITTPINKIRENPGNFPYVTTQATNNGIRFYSSIHTEKGNVLVVDSAVLGWMSYQEKDFSASDHVEKLTPKFKLNKEIGLFIISVWNSIYSQEFFNYKRKASQKAIKECSIPLPINHKGEPDWKYMEDHIKNLSYKKLNLEKLEELPRKIKNDTKINLGKWKKFNLCGNNGIFELKNSISKVHNQNIKGAFGNIPYVTRTEINNGVAKYIPEQKVKINAGNCLTIGMDAITIFYQEKDFYTGDKIKILRNNNLNKINSLFLITVISNKIKENFCWGGKGMNFKELEKLTIKLPSKNNQPDWKYMEEYIKNLSKKIENTLK